MTHKASISLVAYGFPTATFAIGSRRWEYTLAYPHQIDTIAYLARKVSSAKALAYAKKYGQARELA